MVSLLTDYPLGRPSSDPTHPDFIPSVFKFKAADDRSKEKKIERYETAQKRMKRKLAEQQCEPDDTVTCGKTDSTSEEESFQILASSTQITADPNMEIDFMQSEKKSLMTKISLLEQQVGTLFGF